MKRKVKPGKREAILQAAVEVVAQNGLHETSMSLIIKRSGASAGVIYHYFASKDAILQAAFEGVRLHRTERLFAFYKPGMAPREAFLQFGIQAYRFHREYPLEVRFLQQMTIASSTDCARQEQSDELAADFERCFRPQSEGGILKNWPKPVLQEVTMGMVERLSSLPQEIPEKMLLEIGSSLWSAILF